MYSAEFVYTIRVMNEVSIKNKNHSSRQYENSLTWLHDFYGTNIPQQKNEQKPNTEVKEQDGNETIFNKLKHAAFFL